MAAALVRFGPFELDAENFELRRAGRRIKLDRTPFALLVLLAQRPHRLVTHAEAIREVWGVEVVIEADSALYTAIRKVRRALGDSPARPRFVETVARKGYRFIAATAGAPLPAGSQEPARRALLAVLPLQNLGPRPSEDYFSDGLTEQLIGELGRLSPQELGVIARTSVLRYKGTRKSVAQIGAELGVDYAIEGSARREGSRVRIAVQLIRVRDQTHLWADSFDRPMGQVLRLQAQVAKIAAEKIRLKLKVAPVPAAAVDPDAYDRYLRAHALAEQRTLPAAHRAIRHFEGILADHPGHAPAWAGLAACYARLSITGDSRPHDSFPRAREAAQRALSLDETLADAHIARGMVHFWYEWDWPAAEKEFRRAADLAPSTADALMYLAHVHSNLGRHAQAIPEIRAARRLDPLSLILNTHEAQFLYHAGRNDEAIAPLEHVLELAPRFWVASVVLGKILGLRDLHGQAIRRFLDAQRHSSGNTEAVGLRGYTLARAGRAAAARRLLRDLAAPARNHYVPPVHRAFVLLGLGEHCAALDELETAVQEHDVRLTFLAVEPRWEPLRTDPRFERILRRVGLPAAGPPVAQ